VLFLADVKLQSVSTVHQNLSPSGLPQNLSASRANRDRPFSKCLLWTRRTCDQPSFSLFLYERYTLHVSHQYFLYITVVDSFASVCLTTSLRFSYQVTAFVRLHAVNCVVSVDND